MIRRSTWVVLALLIVTIVSAILIQRSNEDAAAQPTPLPTTQKFLEVDQAAVERVTVEAANGKQLELTRSKDDQWVLSDPGQVAETDSAAVQSALGVFLGSQVVSSPSSLPGLDVLNLDKAAYTISLVLQDGSPVVIQVGNPTPTGSGYYVLTNQNSQVIVVNKYGIDQVLALLENPPLLPTPTMQVEAGEGVEETPSP